jgi:tetrahydromethanopterin S-methyltransferase subunit G
MATTPDLERVLRNHLDNDTKRLDRIEAKIDRLSETVVSLARVEEKVTALDIEASRTNQRLEKIDSRLEVVEGSVGNNDITIKVINKLSWLTISAIAAGAIAYYFQ